MNVTCADVGVMVVHRVTNGAVPEVTSVTENGTRTSQRITEGANPETESCAEATMKFEFVLSVGAADERAKLPGRWCGELVKGACNYRGSARSDQRPANGLCEDIARLVNRRGRGRKENIARRRCDDT